MTIAPITDHEGRATDNLLSQFDDSPKIRALVEILVSEIQKQEDFLQEILDELLLANAEGIQLDNIYGKLVGLVRSFLTVDDDYRKVIQVRMDANLSNGEINTILRIAATLFGAVINYEQAGRATYLLTWENTPLTDPEYAALGAKILCDATAAGVGFQFIEHETGAFTFDIGPGFDVGKFGTVVGADTQGIC